MDEAGSRDASSREPFCHSTVFLLLLMATGFSLRLLFAWIRYDFHFADEYTEVIRPAFHWLFNRDWRWESTMRSHLTPRLFHFLLRSFSSLGASDPVALVRLAYSSFGLYSLITLYISFLYGRRLEGQGALFLTISAAFHYLFLDLSTKPNLDALAQPLLLSGVYMISRGIGSGKRWYFLSGSALMSGSVLFRFQLFFLFAVTFLYLLTLFIIRRAKKKGGGAWSITPPSLLLFLAGGLLIIPGQAAVDLLSGAPILSVFGNYLSFQYKSVVEFGPPEQALNYFLLILISKVFLPYTFFLMILIPFGIRRFPLEGVLFLSLLFIYHISPRKEFRFIYPVLPLGLLLTGAGIDWLKGALFRRGRLLPVLWKGLASTVLTAYLIGNFMAGRDELGKRPFGELIDLIRESDSEVPIRVIGTESVVVPDVYLGRDVQTFIIERGGCPVITAEEGTRPDTLILRRDCTDALPEDCTMRAIISGSIREEFWHIYRCEGGD